jgi:hypothetical protein
MVIVLNRRGQLHLKSVKRNNFELIDHKHDLRLPLINREIAYLQLVLLYADQHVDRVVNLYRGRVKALEALLADLTEDAADGIKAIGGEVICVVGIRGIF